MVATVYELLPHAEVGTNCPIQVAGLPDILLPDMTVCCSLMPEAPVEDNRNRNGDFVILPYRFLQTLGASHDITSSFHQKQYDCTGVMPAQKPPPPKYSQGLPPATWQPHHVIISSLG